MKITFLCGCLEPGKDGVGDYTRRLAGELIRKGHAVKAVALKDFFVPEILIEEADNQSDLSVLRLSEKLSNRRRISETKKWIENFGPDWLSLQYVPFSFDRKGLPFGLAKLLKEVNLKTPWQLMFHELWIEYRNTLDIKKFILRSLQKRLIKRLASSLQPSVIHTQLPYNQLRLEKIGLIVKKLPLFSNIELMDENACTDEKGILRVAVFSQVEVNISIINFLKELQRQAEELQLITELVLFGGEEDKMQAAVKIIESLEGFKGQIKYAGFLGSKEISNLLQTCALGLTPVPRHVLGKSGSVAAFIAHGLPVAAPIGRKGFNEKKLGFFSSTLSNAVMMTPDLSSLQVFANAALQARHIIKLSSIAETFIEDLQNSTTEYSSSASK